nr:MAG TPA: hypothetical protein [Caudoviricetes sp.]
MFVYPKCSRITSLSLLPYLLPLHQEQMRHSGKKNCFQG